MMIRYTIWRLLIFVVVLLVLFAVGFRSWALLILSALISLVVSFFALSGAREQFAEQVDRKVSERRARVEAFRNADDDDLDEDE
ncbi:cell division protein FtsW (lipid II flippase) [Flexivirga oryzae]|uniref:Cell division protein FtsW (Lipid II flippase) n=2 Tax=Flexivirga oryzae TaxID=1794944 RepID=A0A839NDY8_9MICO|nr:cell division protein FtsW (lipid II flippase) [Flexivirga oryzae]